MPKPTAKKKKPKKNPTDVNLLARSVVEAAIGEPLTTLRVPGVFSSGQNWPKFPSVELN